MPPTPTIFLFDVDGTLLTSAGAGRRSLELALTACCGVPDTLARVAMAGMTDRAIVRRGLETAGQRPTEAGIDEVLARYLEVLPQEIARTDGFRLLPGVESVLEALAGRPQHAVGLGTGNIEVGAYLKLQAVGIADRFPFGGFGSDHEDRTELLRRGAERGARHLQVPLARCRVVVVGDTPRDVAAARGLGVECLAVTTGPYGAAELDAAGPSYRVEDLCGEGVLPFLLGADDPGSDSIAGRPSRPLRSR